MPEQSRQLAAIMFTDIVGYTKLMQQDEKIAIETRKRHRKIFNRITGKYQGKILQYYGDGTLSIFGSAIDAVECGIEMQKEFQKNPKVPVRIGIHTGDVVFSEDEIIGDGVNVAARVESLAISGGVCISEKVYDEIKNQAKLKTLSMGYFELKNVEKPLEIYAMANPGLTVPEREQMRGKTKIPAPEKTSHDEGGDSKKIIKTGAVMLGILLVGYLLYLFGPTVIETLERPNGTELAAEQALDKSIAVLPFRDDSEGSDNQYFCDGMMDEILSHLQKIADLGVKSRTAVEPYRNSTQSFAAIAQELDVAFILEGAVRKYGDRFRLTAQLIEVESRDHLWSESYDGIFSDTIFVVQSHIAKKIVSSLNVVITPEEENRIDKMPTTDIAAYDLYIRAQYERMNYRWTLENKHLKTAHDLYDRALQIDPEYLMAIIGKGGIFFAQQNYDSAIAYAERASVLDPEFNRAYGLKGECYFIMGENDLAIENYLKAISLPPKDGFWLWYHVALGRAYNNQKNGIIKGLPYLKKGLEMPSDDLPVVYATIGWSYLNIGDYEKSEEYFKKALNLQVSCYGIRNYSWLMLVQGKALQAFQFTDSICKEIECERICNGLLLKESSLLKEFEQAESYYYQWEKAKPVFDTFQGIIEYEIGYVYYQLGKIEEAEKIFNEQIEKLQSNLDQEERLEYLLLSGIYALQGKSNEALEHLAEYARGGFNWGWHDFILIDPFFENLRDDPEFQAIVKRAQDKKAGLRAQVKEMEQRGELDL